MKNALITIIVAVYNEEERLQRCIDSIASQTYLNKELIVMDGGSTDGTLDTLRNNNSKIAYWESKPDKGIYDAWNKALDHSKGEWICFLGADDFLWKFDVLEMLSPHFQLAYPQSRLLYGQVAFVVGDKTTDIENGSFDRNGFCKKMNIHHSGTMHHRSLFEIHGKFDISFKVAADYDFMLRELKNKSAYFVDDVVVAGIEIGGISSTLVDPALTFREHRRARKNNGLNDLSIKLEFHLFLRFFWFFLSKILGKDTANMLADLYRKTIGKPPYFYSSDKRK